MTPRFSAVILAAGESSRLGCDKLSLALGRETILEHTVSKFVIDPVIEIIVITGKFIPQSRSLIASPKIQWVPNPDYVLGMSSSIKRGIEQVSASADAVFITPADIPLFTAATVQRMINVFSPDKIVIPACRDKKGHPVLLGKKFIEPCLREQEEKVLYELIAKNTDAINYLPVEDEGILMDLDTLEDYEALKRYYDTFNNPMTK